MVLIMNEHISKWTTFLYFLKIRKLPTLKGQSVLEGIFIKLLPGINQPHASSKTP